MNRSAALPLLLVVAACSGSPASGAGVTALTGGTVIDVISGRTIPDAVVLISGGHILSLGPRAERPVPPGASEVELPGSWIIPGLIDMHADLSSRGLRLATEWGVTTVRDFAADSAGAALLRVRSDTTARARLIIALPLAGLEPAEYDSDPDTVLKAAITRLIGAGGNWLVAPEQISERSLARLVGTARLVRLLVAVNANELGAVAAARSGANSIEGMGGVAGVYAPTGSDRDELQRWGQMQRDWLMVDTARLGTVAASMAGRATGFVPALIQDDSWARLDDSAVTQLPELGLVAESVRTTWNADSMVRRAGWTRSDFADFRLARMSQDEFVRRFSRLGGLIAVGSHAGEAFIVPGVAVHQEMELLVAAGLTPLQALRAATSDAAKLLGADSLGRLGPGSVADLIVLSANPLDDIRNSREISRVMIAGRWLQR